MGTAACVRGGALLFHLRNDHIRFKVFCAHMGSTTFEACAIGAPTNPGTPMNILQIHASARDDASHSSRLARRIVGRLRERNPGASVVLRDLARTPAPALDAATLAALASAPQQRGAEDAARVAAADTLIAELQAADVVVLGVPMYNFGVPSALKDWIDAIARAGVTFRYTAAGPQGLLDGKTAWVALTRGGRYRNTPADTQVPYLRMLFNFLGIDDVRFVFAEGLSMGPEAEREGLEAAEAEIEALLADADTQGQRLAA